MILSRISQLQLCHFQSDHLCFYVKATGSKPSLLLISPCNHNTAVRLQEAQSSCFRDTAIKVGHTLKNAIVSLEKDFSMLTDIKAERTTLV